MLLILYCESYILLLKLSDESDASFIIIHDVSYTLDLMVPVEYSTGQPM